MSRRLGAACLLVAVIATLAAWAGAGVRSTYGGQAAVDEPQYLLTALSLWEDRSLDISDELAERRWAAYFDAELPVQTQPRPDGSQLSPHDPLLPVLLAVPVGWDAGRAGWLGARLALGLVAGGLAALLMWTAVRRLAVPLPVAATGATLATASPPLAVYGAQVYPELPASLVVLAAAAALLGPLGRRGLAVVALAVIALPWLGVKYAPVAAVLAAVALVRLLRSGRQRPAAGVAAVWAVAGVAYLAVHRAVYGGWTVYAAGDHFQATGELSVVGVDPDYVGRSLRLAALLVDRGFGLAVWQPAWLLAVPALAALLVRRPAGWPVLALPLAAGWATATWLALTMHGFWWPGRQVVVVLPLAALAVLWWLGRVAVRWRLPALLAGSLGVVAYGWLVADGLAGRLTWVVGFESVGSPAVQLLRPLLPDYRAGWAGFWPLHIAWSAGLLGAAALAARQARSVTTAGRPAGGTERTAVPAAAVEERNSR